jgi:hypothetical protein
MQQKKNIQTPKKTSSIVSRLPSRSSKSSGNSPAFSKKPLIIKHQTPIDCWKTIVEYINSTKTWIRLSYTCRGINQLKYSQYLMKTKCRTTSRLCHGRYLNNMLKVSRGTLFNLSLKQTKSIDDDTLKSLKENIYYLTINDCPGVKITDVGFSYLEGIKKLSMVGCNLKITAKAFSYLKGIHTLNITDNWLRITDSYLKNLEGIHTLHMAGRFDHNKMRFTDIGFSYLKGIQVLDITNGHELGITDHAFTYLKGIHTLKMAKCFQITDKGISKLTYTNTDCLIKQTKL